MSSVDCPRCEESFRVPDAPLPQGVRLRCPWCLEQFNVQELSERLLPMVELVDDEGQPVDISHWLSAGAVSQAIPVGATSVSSHALANAHGRETSPSFEQNAVEDEGELGFTAFEISSEEEQSEQRDDPEEDRLAQFEDEGIDQEDMRFSDVDADDELADPSLETDDDREFESDEFVEDDEAFEDERNQYEHDAHGVPVTGPVEPRPLSSVTARDLGEKITAVPRKKKKSSPIKSILGPILGGVAGLAIGGAFLEYMGKPLFWPFDGTLTQKFVASAPMELSDERPVLKGEPGRSLAEDLGTPSPTDPISSAQDPLAAQEPGSSDLSVSPAAPDAGVTMPTADAALASGSAEADSAVAGLAADLASDPSTAGAVAKPVPDIAESATSAAEPNPPATSPAAPIAPDPASSGGFAMPLPQDQPADQPADLAASNMNAAPAASAGSEQPRDVPATQTPSPTPAEAFDFPASPALQAALDKTTAVLGEFSKADPADTAMQKRLKANLYAALAEVATEVSEMDQQQVTATLNRIEEAGLLADMGKAAPLWLRFAGRKSSGILASGTLVQEDAKWSLSWIGGTPLQLEFDPSIQSMAAGDQVTLLGTIVESQTPPQVKVNFVMKR